MAVIRETTNDVSLERISAYVFFCVMMCSVFMLKFRGFKVNFDLSSGKTFGTQHDSGLGVNGAYRIHKEDHNGYNHIYAQNPQPKQPKPVANPPPRPSMVNLPQDAKLKSGVEVARATKSTSDLTQPKNIPTHSNSCIDVSYDPTGGQSHRNPTNNSRSPKSKETNIQAKEQKKLDKKRLAEQKKREKIEAQQRVKQEKIAAKERAWQEKQKKEREKQEEKARQRQAKTMKPPEQRMMNPLAQTSTQYSTNTLESSISKTSGPPPYTESPKTKPEVIPNEYDNTGNTSFNKRPSVFSWDKIAQHKQEINRPSPGPSAANKTTKQTVLDLNFDNKPRKSIYI